MPTYQDLGLGRSAVLSPDRTRAVFGHVMGLVAFTLGFAALGAYVARNLAGGSGILFLLVALADIFALNAAVRRGHEQLATGLLFGLGLILGMAVAPLITFYAKADPGVVYQAAGATGAFVAILGGAGYATRRDLSPMIRPLMIAFVVVWIGGLIALLASIPGANVVYCVLMLAVFGGFTAFDFNRLARAGYDSAIPIAASIFLDVFNVFILLMSLLGGGGSRR